MSIAKTRVQLLAAAATPVGTSITDGGVRKMEMSPDHLRIHATLESFEYTELHALWAILRLASATSADCPLTDARLAMMLKSAPAGRTELLASIEESTQLHVDLFEVLKFWQLSD